MDFYKDIIQPVGGFCICCFLCLSWYNSCSDSDETKHPTKPSSDFIDTGSSPGSNSSSSSSSSSSSGPEFEEYWYDDPFCDGTGNCPACHGEKGFYTEGDYTKIFNVCGLCGGHGKCNNCGGQGQVKGFRQVN